MPLRKEFFIDPLFRLTQPFSLNDPFDSKPTKEAIRKKIAFMSDSVGEGAGFISDQEIESKHFNVKKYLEEELHKFGIISLTENPHNLLMWSHYADEHNGVVISISNTDDTFSFSEHGIDRSRIGNKSAIRVLYDSKRPGANIPDECIYSIYEDEFFKHFALVKSDNWIYEKEHRFLMPISEADVCILKATDNKQLNVEFKNYLDKRKIDFIEDKNTYTFENKNLSNPINDVAKIMHDDVAKQVGEIMFFKRLKPNAIQGIYFGCRVQTNTINEIMQMVRMNEKFSSNILFYKASENQDRFDIDFEPIYN